MKLSNMASVLRAAGLTVVETQGWKTRGYAGQDLAEVRGVLWHHTATHRSRFNEDAPTLNMCVNGRPDLPGPLCNIVLGRTGTVYLVAAGVANHAGRGVAHGIPENTGNHYLIGIEMESSGVAPWDWTPDQIRVAPHLGAALERAYLQRLPEDMRLQLGHKEYSYDGKIDPAGWPGDMDGLRAAINRILSGTVQTQSVTPKEDTLSAKEVQEIKNHINAVLLGGYSWAGKKHPGIGKVVEENQRRVTALRAVVEQLAAKQGVDIDYAKIEAAVQAGAAKAIEDADLLTAGDVVSVDVNVTGK